MKDSKKIFISWSGDTSKAIALELKIALERIFGHDLCFVSDADIASGTDWFEKIKDELVNCQLGIFIITKSNMLEPWIYFEAGALVSSGVSVIPLIFEADVNLLKNTPLGSKHAVKFSDVEKFIKMINDINSQLSLLTIDKSNISVIANSVHNTLCTNLNNTFQELRNKKAFSSAYIYPKNIRTINSKSIFISVPMASVNAAEYKDMQTFAVQLTNMLSNLGYKTISPANNFDSQIVFEGAAKAIKNNFKHLKQAEYIIAVYPRKVASSLLTEIGYGIALTKRVIIFHKEELPYILSEARGNINHVMTIPYTTNDEIIKYIKANGDALFSADFESEGE